MAIGGFYVVAKNEKDLNVRYLLSIKEGKFTFGPKRKASISLGNGKFTGTKDQETATRLVDLAQEAAAAGKISAVWASAQMETYEGRVVYTGGEKKAAAAPTVYAKPPNVECWDKIYRVAPTNKFEKTFRGWKYAYAFVDAAGVPRADVVSADSQIQLVRIIFDPDFPIYRELVLTFPVSNPADLVEQAPVKEHVPKIEEINAVQPLTDEEFDRPVGGSSVQRAKYESDPKYRLAYDRREYLRKKFRDDNQAKLAREEAAAAAESAKNKLKISQELGEI
jgi:hypothetical protein